MGTEIIPETMVSFEHLTRLMGRESLIELVSLFIT